eukprot:Tbor_TRINITY_DN5500_c6_g8::TRINITY_DN5500_c6_g8_i1::g.12859::m.12859/K20301/TRAPPC2, TRS20; trafficking protein particle complex subunit 2
MVAYFAIVGPQDAAVFEYCTTEKPPQALQFMAHGALDVVEEMMWTTEDFYLPKVDKIDGFDDTIYVSAYVGIGQLKLLILQDQGPHSSVKGFFIEMHELCVKYVANPFVDCTKPVTSKAFIERAKTIFHRYF